MTTLQAIEARLRNATGPDRELDLAIGEMLTAGERGLWQMMYTHPESAPRYTASIDAALTLLDGCEYSLRWEDGRAYVEIGDPRLMIEADAPTPALALCLAAIRARIAELEAAAVATQKEKAHG